VTRHRIPNPQAVGSNPAGGINFKKLARLSHLQLFQCLYNVSTIRFTIGGGIPRNCWSGISREHTAPECEVGMSTPLLFRFTIPVTGGSCLVFRHWLPLQKEDALTVTERELQLRFWMDEKCLGHVTDVDLNDISNYMNIFVDKMYVDVDGCSVPDDVTDDLIQLLKDPDWREEHINSSYDPRVLTEYQSIRDRIYASVIQQWNRVIAYVRAVKGQYWLEEYKLDFENVYSEVLKLDAKMKVGEADWLRLKSPPAIYLRGEMPTGQRLIGREDWEPMRKYLQSDGKAPLVGQLLASADEFRDSGHRRAALTEAVAALEVAISQFAQNANPENWSTLLAGRSSSVHFKNHVGHLGITCTLGYLFPVIFSEEQISSSTLLACQEAMFERNTVVHQGQRDVDQRKLGGYLEAIRLLCERLRELQTGSRDSE
jgi:hypothetical protein